MISHDKYHRVVNDKYKYITIASKHDINKLCPLTCFSNLQNICVHACFKQSLDQTTREITVNPDMKFKKKPDINV